MIVTICQCQNIEYRYPVLAWLISIFQGLYPWRDKNWHNHMAFKIESLTGKVMYLDATGKGVRFNNESEFLSRYKVVGSMDVLVNAGRGAFEAWGQAHLNIDYDRLQIIGNALQVLKFICYNTIGRDFKKLTCAEFILKAFVDFNKLKIKDPDSIDLVRAWNISKRFKHDK